MVGTIIVDEDGIYDSRHPNDRLLLGMKGTMSEPELSLFRQRSLPLYNTVHNILTNPVYAGAYAFGRTTSKVIIEDGRKCVRRGLRRPLAEWDVLIKDQHDGYITWEQFERNQRVIADNATGKGSAIARGVARRGELILAGCSDAVTAAARCTWATASPGATTARARMSTMAPSDASPSAA